MPGSDRRTQVVVVGGGFGGLQAIRALVKADVDVTLIDRNNYHLFQPLSYQVATGALAPGEIAVPLRRIFRGDPRVRVLMGEVSGFDLARREVHVDPAIAGTRGHAISYDTLVVAGGSSYAYFGHDEWRSLALEVKSLDSALQVRGRVLQAFEAAELEDDPQARAQWLTFVVVGAGPTGVEMAGQIAELARDTLPAEFRHSDPRAGRVLLIEMADRVLGAFAPSLSRSAQSALEGIGVRALLRHRLIDVCGDRVTVQDPDGRATQIITRTVVWAAGVTASPLARALGEAAGAEVDRAGRVIVQGDLTLPGHPEVLGSRRHGAGARPRRIGAAAAGSGAGGDAAGSLRRRADRPPPGRALAAALPLSRQGHARDDRPWPRGGPAARRSLQRPARLGGVAGRAPLRGAAGCPPHLRPG